MPNEFSVKPELSDDFPRQIKTWKCALTDLVVPKDPDANLKWREKLWAEAEDDEDLQDDLYTACSQSLLFFVNAFMFTLRVFESQDGQIKQADEPHIPFVTWEIQDRHLLRLEHCVEHGESLLTDKSRDMGATWNHIAVYTHRFLFRDDESHLMISRKEDAVDNLDGHPKGYPFGSLADPGTLMGKIDYVLSRLPEWMLPRIMRKKLHLVNLDTSTRIDGESANATAGSSDRRTSIFMDEMAKMKEGESIKRSTADVTACRLPCSTPNGAGTAYSKWRMSGQIPVFILPWWEHPEKGAGRYLAQDKLGRWKIRSPWYDREEERRSPKELAIEIDMDHVGSGDLFFEPVVLEQHKKLFGRPPQREIFVNWPKNLSDEAIRENVRRRSPSNLVISPRTTRAIKWKVWGNLIRMRPDQSYHYVISVDIGKGMGASNSVINVSCVETREKIASLATAEVVPHELAKLATAAATWAGGKHQALIIWENNGDPGFDFGRQLVHVYEYPNIYFDRQPGTIAQKRGKRYGWRSNQEAKAAALGMLRRAYAQGSFFNPDEDAIDEALQYVYYDGGGVGPAELVEESPSARKTHGDRVIADMLFLVAIEGSPLVRDDDAPAKPTRSIGHRLEQFRKAKKNRAKQERFDFRRGA